MSVKYGLYFVVPPVIVRNSVSWSSLDKVANSPRYVRSPPRQDVTLPRVLEHEPIRVTLTVMDAVPQLSPRSWHGTPAIAHPEVHRARSFLYLG